MTTHAPIFARERNAAKVLDMTPVEFRALVDRGLLPGRLAACVPTVDRADCTDGATWRDACSRDRAAVERPEPEPGGHWATRDNEPDSRTDPEGHRDWQRDRDAQRREGTW